MQKMTHGDTMQSRAGAATAGLKGEETTRLMQERALFGQAVGDGREMIVCKHDQRPVSCHFVRGILRRVAPSG
jgi:hypothetical protein